MSCLLYDGSFTGLLCSLDQALLEATGEVEINPADRFQPDLFSIPENIMSERARAEELWRRLYRCGGAELRREVYYSYLSEVTGIETALSVYLRIRFRIAAGEIPGPPSPADPVVIKVYRTIGWVGHEVHRMHAFVRFRKLASGVYYAPIEPDHNIVALLEPHFTARFQDQQWFIHDVKRKTGLHYDGRECRFVSGVEMRPEMFNAPLDFTSLKPEALAEDELFMEQLWNGYFHEIAIAERKNPRLQRQRMPCRYWKHMVEKVK